MQLPIAKLLEKRKFSLKTNNENSKISEIS